MSVPLQIFLGALAAILVWAGFTMFAFRRRIGARAKREEALDRRIAAYEQQIKRKSQAIQKEVDKFETVTPEQDQVKKTMADILAADEFSRHLAAWSTYERQWSDILRRLDDNRIVSGGMVFATIDEAIANMSSLGNAARKFEILKERLSGATMLEPAETVRSSDAPKSRPRPERRASSRPSKPGT